MGGNAEQERKPASREWCQGNERTMVKVFPEPVCPSEGVKEINYNRAAGLKNASDIHT